MQITILSPSFQKRFERLQELNDRPALQEWQAQLSRILDSFHTELDIDDAFQLLHESQRLLKVYDAGLENNEAFLAAVKSHSLPTWQEFGTPPASEALQRNLGDKLYNIDRVDNPYAMLVVANPARIVMTHLADRLLEDAIPFDVDFYDLDYDALIINHASDTGIKSLAAK